MEAHVLEFATSVCQWYMSTERSFCSTAFGDIELTTYPAMHMCLAQTGEHYRTGWILRTLTC